MEVYPVASEAVLVSETLSENYLTENRQFWRARRKSSVLSIMEKLPLCNIIYHAPGDRASDFSLPKFATSSTDRTTIAQLGKTESVLKKWIWVINACSSHLMNLKLRIIAFLSQKEILDLFGSSVDAQRITTNSNITITLMPNFTNAIWALIWV